MVSIVYFGTPETSATVLEALYQSNLFEIKAVVTQPTRPVGREQNQLPSPVKVAAEKHNLKVYEFESLKNVSPDDFPKAELFFVYAYGLIIPKNILSIPKHGTLNIHPSLLPKYRGPTPVQAAIMNGDKSSGVSIMAIDEKMDHGPILGQTYCDIEETDTTETLTKKLISTALPLILKLTSEWVEGKISATTQDETLATYCKLLSRDDGRIDWHKNSIEIFNMFRALSPWPGLWTTLNNKRLKVIDLKQSEEKISPGKMRSFDNKIFVGCKDSSIEVLTLQLEGKKPTDAKTFLNGHKNVDNELLV
jgi:methionyl-tRNA formyltransferase